MQHDWSVLEASETGIRRLAERLALKVGRGDTIALSGPLGAGKTTFARALIRALTGRPEAEVPSPTFSLVQTYEAARFNIAHVDLYRIASAGETAELGVEDMMAGGALIIEWGERAPGLLSADRLEIRLGEGRASDTRTVRMTGLGTWGPRLERIAELTDFLERDPLWGEAEARYLQGDASARSYARLAAGDRRAVLMDWPRQPDGPPIRDGLPYSRIAHLAEDVRPFVAVAQALRAAGLSVPEILAADLERGFLILEDLGDRVFAAELEAGASQGELWRAATDALVILRRLPVPGTLPLPDGSSCRLPPQDRGALQIETELLLDWYWPALLGEPPQAGIRAEFLAHWNAVFDRLLAMPRGWVLRDYHSPNLMWLPERHGARRVGILDFQDALQAPPAYDLVSLLQDARVDVAPDLEAGLIDRYCSAAANEDRGFDRDAFGFAYAALGAQRSTKILGIFARLARRDGKAAYLRHTPRLWRYLERYLEHPGLTLLRAWYDRHLPPDIRTRILEA